MLSSFLTCLPSTLYTDDMTIRTRLGREGSQILQNPTTDASSGTAAEASVDFEIEPDVYRSVEAMVKSLAAGKHACVTAGAV
jgi:hypothetical protein